MKKSQIVFGKTADDSSSLIELEKNADLIVVATKLNDEVNKVIKNRDGRIDDGYILSKIKEVLQKILLLKLQMKKIQSFKNKL